MCTLYLQRFKDTNERTDKRGIHDTCLAKSIVLEAKPKRYGDFLPISALLSHYGEIQKTHVFLFYFNFFVWSRS